MKKPFSLEEYRKNPSKKIVTRDGRNVRIICTDRRGDYPIIVLTENQGNDEETLVAFTENGRWALSGKESVNDLFFATEKHEGWVIIFKAYDGDTYLGNSGIYRTKEEAEESGKNWSGYIATVKIEWEE